MFAGLSEDFRRIIVNMRQELVLIRSSNDLDAVTSIDDSEKPKVELTKVFWRVPHITPSIQEQLRITKITNESIELPIRFRS